MSEGKVTVSESTSIKVGKYVRAYHPELSLAGCLGDARDSLFQDDSLGLLHNEHVEPRGILERLFRCQPRRKFVGTFWFRNSAREVKSDEWLLEVHGNEFVETMQALAKELATAFSIKIHVRLVSESARLERLY